MTPYYIEYNYQQVEVPHDILWFCDHVTFDAERTDLRYIDCVYMQMGYYGNDLQELKKYRDEWINKKQDSIHTTICPGNNSSRYTL